jgi:hypothetical protein
MALFSRPISATDAHSGGTLSFSATNLPAGLSISCSTGTISGTLTDGGSWTATVTATDGTYTNSVSFSWTVESPITMTDQGDQVNNDGDTSVSVQISATDNASGTLSYSASNLPSGLSINSTTGLITGTVGSSADASSPYAVTITVTDSTNTAVDTFNWTVNSTPIAVTNPGNQTNIVGDQVALAVQATDANGGTLAYTATGLPSGLNINPITGLIFGTISSSAASSNTVTVEAADGSNHQNVSFA